MPLRSPVAKGPALLGALAQTEELWSAQGTAGP